MNQFKTFIRLVPKDRIDNKTDFLFTYPRHMPAPMIGETINYKDVDYTVTHKRNLSEYSTIIVFVQEDDAETC